jgi:hypothetical protein
LEECGHLDLIDACVWSLVQAVHVQELLNVMIWPMMTQWMDSLAGYMSFFAFSYLFL